MATPLQYSCLENPMDRGAWLATYSPWGHKVSKHRSPWGCHCILWQSLSTGMDGPRWPPHREAGFTPVWQSLPAPWCQACLGHSSAPLAVIAPTAPWGGPPRAQRRGWMGRTQHWLQGSLASLADPSCSSGQVSHPSRALSVPQEARRLDHSRSEEAHV